MLKQIDQNSKNIFYNQGDKHSVDTHQEQTTLFDQFSEILDKIATSLNQAHKVTKGQDLNDLSFELSQAASQVVQKPAPVPEKLPEHISYKEEDRVELNKHSADESTTPAREEQVQQVKSVIEQPEVKVLDKTKQQTQSSGNTDDQVQLETNQSNENVDLKSTTVLSDKQGVSEITVADQEISDTQINEIVEGAPVQPVKDVKDISSAQSQVITEEIVAEDIQPQEIVDTKNFASSSVSQHEIQTKEVQQNIENQDISLKVDPQDPKADNEKLEVALETSTEVLTSVHSIVDKSVVPVVKAVQADPAFEDLRTQEILAQSAQALLAQLIYAVPQKQLLEASSTGKLMQLTQAGSVTQHNSHNSGTGLPLTSLDKATVQVRERAQARELPRPAVLRTMERVESALKELARSKDGKTISLRLDPPSLGSVKIDITHRDGNLHARLVAESPQVNALLRDQSAELQQMLRRAGIQAEKITVSVAADQQNTSFESFTTSDNQASGKFSQGSHKERGNTAELVNGSNTQVSNEALKNISDHWVA